MRTHVDSHPLEDHTLPIPDIHAPLLDDRAQDFRLGDLTFGRRTTSHLLLPLPIHSGDAVQVQMERNSRKTKVQFRSSTADYPRTISAAERMKGKTFRHSVP